MRCSDFHCAFRTSLPHKWHRLPAASKTMQKQCKKSMKCSKLKHISHHVTLSHHFTCSCHILSIFCPDVAACNCHIWPLPWHLRSPFRRSALLRSLAGLDRPECMLHSVCASFHRHMIVHNTCVSVCVCARVYLHAYVCKIYLYIYIHTYISISFYIYLYLYLYLYLYIYIYISISISNCVYIYIYINMQMPY